MFNSNEPEAASLVALVELRKLLLPPLAALVELILSSEIPSVSCRAEAISPNVWVLCKLHYSTELST